MTSVLLKEACDVFFGAGRPSERRAIIHQLPGHNERVPASKLTVVPLAVMINSKTANTINITNYRYTKGFIHFSKPH